MGLKFQVYNLGTWVKIFIFIHLMFNQFCHKFDPIPHLFHHTVAIPKPLIHITIVSVCKRNAYKIAMA
jgi:hypothetical protein